MNHQDYLCVLHTFTSRWVFKISFCPSVTYDYSGTGECKAPRKIFSMFRISKANTFNVATKLIRWEMLYIMATAI